MVASHRSSTWLLLAGAAWAMGFAVVHLYWAAGGRAGVPAGAGAIGARPWFLAYDLVAAAALAAAAVTGVALAANWGGAGRRRWLGRAAVSASCRTSCWRYGRARAGGRRDLRRVVRGRRDALPARGAPPATRACVPGPLNPCPPSAGHGTEPGEQDGFRDADPLELTEVQ